MTGPDPDAPKAGASIVGVGAAACAACCAVPILGFVTAFVVSASAVALAVGGILLAVVVAAAGAGLIVWRRHRTARATCAPDPVAPVMVNSRAGR